MGSLGTLAQADQSDMDVWVCHGPDLSESELTELRKKCQLLEIWAASQGAEAHFFLIDPARFVLGERDTQLSSEDCGTTQHYLLLDEFYRTAIWLAGRTPIWWLVPVYEEAAYDRYTHTLLSKRFIRADETLDLGHLSYIPPGEFIGAGLWQLFKGIESPYKSVLKLLLTEVYASEHPKVQCLSLRFKQAVFANRLDLDELDPYVVVYRRIEEYLTTRGEPERLELVRRALYLKVNRKLTGSSGRTQSWQRSLLERLANEWHWDQRQLALLDSRSQWKVRQVSDERRALVGELNYSYRFLTQFARNEQTVSLINKRDLNVLGRRLYAAFERKADKVEFINPGIAPRSRRRHPDAGAGAKQERTGANPMGFVQRQPDRPRVGAFLTDQAQPSVTGIAHLVPPQWRDRQQHPLGPAPRHQRLERVRTVQPARQPATKHRPAPDHCRRRAFATRQCAERSTDSGERRHRSAQAPSRPEHPDDHRAHRFPELRRRAGKPGADPGSGHAQ